MRSDVYGGHPWSQSPKLTLGRHVVTEARDLGEPQKIYSA